jgi:hypothetical protein
MCWNGPTPERCLQATVYAFVRLTKEKKKSLTALYCEHWLNSIVEGALFSLVCVIENYKGIFSHQPSQWVEYFVNNCTHNSLTIINAIKINVLVLHNGQDKIIFRPKKNGVILYEEHWRGEMYEATIK